MRIFVTSILIFCMISTSLGAAFYGYFGKSDNPGKCFVNGLILSSGQIHYDNLQCSKLMCNENSMALFVSCGVKPPPDNCKFGGPVDPNAQYPDCCDRLTICDNIVDDEN